MRVFEIILENAVVIILFLSLVIYGYVSGIDAYALEKKEFLSSKRRIFSFGSKTLDKKEIELLKSLEQGQQSFMFGKIEREGLKIYLKPFRRLQKYSNVMIGYIDLSQNKPKMEYVGGILEYYKFIFGTLLMIVGYFYLKNQGEIINVLMWSRVVIGMIPAAVIATITNIFLGRGRVNLFLSKFRKNFLTNEEN